MTLENDMEEKIRIFYCYRKWEFFYQKSSLDFQAQDCAITVCRIAKREVKDCA